jgi:cytochrome b6-f complex iron-sulfur subunit
MSRLDPPSVTRRSILTWASIGSFFTSMGVALAGALRLPNPTVSPGPLRRFKIGAPELYPVGSETHLEKENVFVFRDEQGVFAVSAVCTHLGCIVARSQQGFACPCHGSKFNHKGDVTGGPAPRALPWLAVGQAADGDLVIYAEREVDPGTKFKV